MTIQVTHKETGHTMTHTNIVKVIRPAKNRLELIEKPFGRHGSYSSTSYYEPSYDFIRTK